MPKSDWSQFIPDIIVGLFLAILLSIGAAILAWFKSDKFKAWIISLLDWIKAKFKLLLKNGRRLFLRYLILILGVVLLVSGTLFFRNYADWRILIFSLFCYLIGLLSWGISIGYPISFKRKKSTVELAYQPIALYPDISNSYLNSRYIDPPNDKFLAGNVQFLIHPDSFIFDISEKRYYTERFDGSKEINLKLSQPYNQIKSVYFLINSSNSRDSYKNKTIGEIKLVFKDAPPIIVPLILGHNIREWCLGSPGSLVREVSDYKLTQGVWTGLSKNGENAVIDCLHIPIFECMKTCFLEQIVFVEYDLKTAPDEMGISYSVYAISLEITQNS